MIFLILCALSILSMLMYFHRKHKNNKRRQCAYGCIKAYNVLDKPGQYSDLKELFETLDSHEERYFYSVSMSRIMFPQALDKWTNSHPDSGDALLCYGARLLQWFWSARGYGRGAEISEAQWKEFFRRLDKTRQVLLECADKTPEDPTPWAYLIMVATWYSDSDELKFEYYEEAIARDPYNWAAHMHMIIALSEKWGGDNQEMLEFARKASRNAPTGSDLKLILVKAYIEYWKYLDLFENKIDEANDFLMDKNIQKDIVDLYNDSLNHESFKETKITIFVRYNLSGWFWLTRDRSRLKKELSILGNKIEDIHWRWVCTEGQLEDARLFANES